jgi:hypothetical protein
MWPVLVGMDDCMGLTKWIEETGLVSDVRRPGELGCLHKCVRSLLAPTTSFLAEFLLD